MPDPRPNLVVFMTDQEQADVSAPGHPCETPNADRLAAEGVRFSRAYCPTAHCCPSRATFMTGRYPSKHGVYNNVSTPTAINEGLRPNVATFAELLAGAGYLPAFSGKWHVSRLEGPKDRGWRELVVNAGPGLGLRRGPDRWRGGVPETVQRAPGEIVRPGWGSTRLYFSYDTDGPVGYEGTHDHAVVTAAVEALEELAAGDAPWVLYVGPTGPHDPYAAPRRYLDRYRSDDVVLPPAYDDDLADKPGIYRRLRRQVWDQLPPDEAREAIRHYWAYCTMEDELLGVVLDALDRTGQADRTVVVRTSDHGDLMGAHGLFMKGIPAFREAYNVPLIVRWPEGVATPGTTVDEFVTLADIAPTLLELGEADPPTGLTGRSLAPFLRGERPADWPQQVCSQMNGVELYYTQRAVTTATHKYVYNGFDFDELYDLARDPHETVNVSDDPAYREVKHDLVSRMWRFADQEEDELLFNPYPTVSLAPWGPASGLAR